MKSSPRDQRAEMARQTLAIVESGDYVAESLRAVTIGSAVRDCIARTRLFMPEAIAALEGCEPRSAGQSTAFEVRNENTLTALARLVAAGSRRVGVLNFASARHPGGGFQGGAQAQEEALARSSALYASLTSPVASAFYQHDREESSCLYSDRVILSPDCPVFRDADGRLIDDALPATFLTCAAPNASALRTNEPAALPLLADAFHRRAAGVLAVAAHAGCDALVLGAWGCGVFGNDPVMVAEVFGRHLRGVGSFEGCFAKVDFAVLDSAVDLARLKAFQRVFQA